MSDVTGVADRPHAPGETVSFREAVGVWLRVAALSFGGPAGQIAVMHRILVEEKRWIGERRFLHALNYCMLLPGPEAQQLATYFGWLLHRTAGGVVAGTQFCSAKVLEQADDYRRLGLTNSNAFITASIQEALEPYFIENKRKDEK